MHLASLRFEPIPEALQGAHPFNVPLVRAGARLDLSAPVTLLVGENGAGKSTVLETLAVGAELPAAGTLDVERDSTLAAARDLAQFTRLSWHKRTRRGLFLRAEDFFGFTQRVARMQQDAETQLQRIRDEDGRLTMRAMPYASDRAALRRLYGEGLEGRSHGEGFLAFFEARFRGEGLYVLDEPEAALSPLRQLTLISLIKSMVEGGGQFVIATHSPILLAFPDARLLHLSEQGVSEAHYDDLEHVRLMRDFLTNPAAFLRHL